MTTEALGDIRLRELDGLRGWAALSVMLFHTCWETFGNAFPMIHNFWIGMAVNGRLPVTIFFVLSGEALSVAYWRNRDQASVARMAIRRYSRLTIPIFCSCFPVYLLMRCGLVQNRAAAPIVDNVEWLGQFLPFSPDFVGLLRYSLFGVYLTHNSHDLADSYNPALWTMKTELIGSFAVFLILLLERHVRRPLAAVVAIGVALLLARSLLACFMFGIVFGQMHARGTFAGLRTKPWMPVLSAAAVPAVLAWASFMQMHGQSAAQPFILASTAFVFFVHASPGLTGFFRNRLSGFWGRLSFPLYLVHLPVLLSLTSAGIVWAHGHGGLTAGVAAGLMAVSILASLLCAVAFYPVEWLTQRVGTRLTRLLPHGARPRLSWPKQSKSIRGPG